MKKGKKSGRRKEERKKSEERKEGRKRESERTGMVALMGFL